MKKLLSVAMAGAMMLTGLAAFAGCVEYTAEIDWDVDLSNPIPLRGLYPETGLGSFGDDDSSKIIEKATGYKMTYQEMGSNADNDVNNFLSTTEEFHIMKLTEAQYHPYLEDGTFLDLTDLLTKTEAGRTLYQLIDLMDYGWDSVKYVDNEGQEHIYAIPDFGFVCMTDSALVWNVNHLEQIGFKDQYGVDIPETLGQVTWALEHLQEKFGADDTAYHALGIPGSNSVEISQIKSAFEVPWNFYVDENGKIQQYVFSDNTTRYAKYMNKLRREGILSDAWQGESQAGANQKFAQELNSCTYISYWNMTALVNAVVSNGMIAKSMGIDTTGADTLNNYEYMRDNAVAWSLRIKGDGSDESVVQEVGRLEGDPGGVSYYTVIPQYMAEDALYIIDFLAKKMVNFDRFYAGEEGTHWNVIPTPEGAPAPETYTPETDAEFTAHEDLAKKIIFIRPYEYKYTRYYNTDPSKGNILDEETMGQEEITVKGGGQWIQLTDRYIAHIADNSQYCNGTNSISAKSLFHLRETGFDAWPVADNEGIGRIPNPMWMCPPMKLWAPISILSRTLLKNGICTAIDQSSAEECVSSLNTTREGAKTTFAKKNGVKYFYWSDAISDEMTEWYNSVKLGR